MKLHEKTIKKFEQNTVFDTSSEEVSETSSGDDIKEMMTEKINNRKRKIEEISESKD